jgi:outer membrane protein assembly factor BamE (lipoprotein component of BamABCDE complex)
MKRFAIALVPLAAACATVGTNYSETALDALRPGMSQAEVISYLGRPTQRTTLADGSEQWMWVYAKANAFGAARSKAVMLKFGPDKRFVEVASATQTQIR